MKLSKKTGFYGLFGIGLFLSLFFCVHIVGTARAGEAGNAVENACRGVVRILTEESQGFSVGSGFGIGHVGKKTDIFVTNWHVVTPEDGSKPDGIYILLSNDAVQRRQDGWYNFDRSQMVECEVLYTTTGYPDLAILKAERPVEDHIALPLLRAQEASRGDSIYAIGFPGTSDYSNGDTYLYAGIDDANISTGVISKFFEYELGGSTWAIQHDAQINHGNSGGPLVTKDGDVIGINTYGFGYADASDEAPGEYSVSIFVDYAMQALNELEIPYNVYDSNMRYILYLLAAVLAVFVVFVLVKKKAKLSGAKASPDPAVPSPSPVPSPNPVPSPAPVPSPSPVKSGWQIQGVSGVFAERKIMIDKKIRMGRATAGNDLIYPANASGISRHHCEIMEENGIVYIRDTGSSYGIYLEGKKIPENQWIKMQEGSSFYLADARESFKVVKTTGT